MLTIERASNFIFLLSKIKNQADLERIKKLIRKIIKNPEIGKPMRYVRKGTREVYAGSFRISYAYIKEEAKLIFLDVYHKDKQ